MNRDEAISIVLAEAFSENGLTMLAHQGADPGFQRMETLIAAVNFLAQDLAREDNLNRKLVSALFALSTGVPEDLQRGLSPTSDSRCSLFQQSNELFVAISYLIENWENWPIEEKYLTPELEAPPDELSSPADEEFEGYRVGDITYCCVRKTEEFFPVRVVRLGFNVIEVAPLDDCRACEAFLDDQLNRCFQSPSLPASARFGGCDERPVNSCRQSGPELRLLPYHYGTMTGTAIRQHHAADPDRWPLPTGTVFERWFKNTDNGGEVNDSLGN